MENVIKEKRLKVAFVGVKERINDMGCEHAPLGLLSMASYLIGKGVSRKEDILIVDTFFDDPIKKLKDFKPDIIAMSAITPFYLLARKYAIDLQKEFKKAKIIIGGAHISSIYSILDKPFLLGAIGEGEETMVEIVKMFSENIDAGKEEFAKIRGVVYRENNDKVKVNRPRVVISELDTIPKVDWTLVDRERVVVDQLIYVENKPKLCKSAYFYTSRGCPYNCTFCAYNNIWGKEAVRFFTPKYFGEVVEELYTKYEVNAFCILDDTFAITKDRVRSMIAELEKRNLLGKVYFFKIFMRANLVDEEMSRLLKKLGVVMMFLGIESGSQRMMDILKNKSLKLSQVRDAIKFSGAAGINIIGSFMFFSPGERKEDIDQTFDFIRWFIKQKNALDANVCITTPFPGTDMWVLPETKDMVKDVEKYLQRVRIDGNQAVSDIFYYNGMSSDYCMNVWKTAEELSGKLSKKWKKRELMFEYTSRFNSVKSIGWKKILARVVNPKKWVKLFKLIYEPIKERASSKKV